MAVPIVVDEWLFHDLWGENGPDNQREAMHFLYKLVELGDQLVILPGSPFEEKVKILMKKSEGDVLVRGISQFFNSSVLRNASATVLLDPADLKATPEHIAKLVPESDHYLFQAHLKVKDSLILTTDGRWHASIYKKGALNIQLRNNFLPQYLKP